MISERRQSARHRFARPFSLLLLGPDGECVGMAAVLDVSAGGLRLVAARPWPVGEVLAVSLIPPHPLGDRRLAFRVNRCVRADGGGHRVAGCFLTPLAEDELVALIGA